MSLARLYYTKKTRKEWKCSGCGDVIPVGSACVSFAVGFRGYEQRRCGKPQCQPTWAERESSAVATVFAAQDDIDWSNLQTLDDIREAVDEVVSAIREVQEEYESNEMFEVNYDLQERAEILDSAASELESWEPPEDEPSEDDFDPDDPDHDFGTFEDQYAEWLTQTVDDARDAVNDVELP